MTKPQGSHNTIISFICTFDYPDNLASPQKSQDNRDCTVLKVIANQPLHIHLSKRHRNYHTCATTQTLLLNMIVFVPLRTVRKPRFNPLYLRQSSSRRTLVSAGVAFLLWLYLNTLQHTYIIQVSSTSNIIQTWPITHSSSYLANRLLKQHSNISRWATTTTNQVSHLYNLRSSNQS